MEKKTYVTPELTLLGDIDEVTQGNGNHSNSDQQWGIRFGNQDPSSGGGPGGGGPGGPGGGGPGGGRR